MNWIIKNTKKVDFHTNLKEVLKPIFTELQLFNWIFSDLDFIANETLPINFEKDFLILSADDLKKVIDARVQIIWGVISAIPIEDELIIDVNELPYAEGNDSIWENGNLQIENSTIEIVAFDSSYTIVKI